MDSQLDLSVLSDDQLVALFRAVLQEAAARNQTVQQAVRSAGLDEAAKARIQAEAAQRAAQRLAREEAERLAREAEAAVRAAKEKEEADAKAAQTKKIWDLKRESAERLMAILGEGANPCRVCVWNGTDKRVYVRLETSKFGANFIEYYATGNRRHKPDSLAQFSAKAAARRGVSAEQIQQETHDWCRWMAAQWKAVEFDTSEALS